MDRIEKAIEQVESQSSTEVVVSIHDSSASYTDVDLLWSILFGLAALSYKIWSPFNFDPDWVVFNVFFCGAVGFLLSRFIWPVRRLLLSGKRLEKSVTRAARAQFVNLGVNTTRGQTGLLLYVTRFERRLVLVPDAALNRSLSPTFWSGLYERLGKVRSESELIANISLILEALSGPLSRRFPRAEDDVDELPNRPVTAS